jgi:uncharacterized protein (TIGR02757 family)
MGTRQKKLKAWLDSVLVEFNHKGFLETDPISNVHSYQNSEDQEFAAFLTALFAFGNVKSILSVSRALLSALGPSPVNKLKSMSSHEIKKTFGKFYYRFYSSEDILHFMKRLQIFLKEEQNFGNFFERNWNNDTFEGLAALRSFFLADIKMTAGLRFMFADPHQSSSKRWHMFLRWMIRKDDIDLGLWNFIPKNRLILPLDTHLFDISRNLGLTQRKSPSRLAAIEITERFKEWDPEDPIKYDFALCRLGILKLKNQRLPIIGGLGIEK